MKENPLLPFAFSSSMQDGNALDTTPRDKDTIDQNAGSLYHTRTAGTRGVNGRRPVLQVNPPTLKRRMGTSFNEKEDIKRRDFDFFHSSDDEEDGPNIGAPNVPNLDNEPIDQLVTDSTTSSKGRSFNLNTTNTTSFDSATPFVHQGEKIRSVTTVIPSSPPPVLPSDFDISTQTSCIPESPSKTEFQNVNEFTNGIPKKSKMPSSEPDFGIDSFNRFKANTSVYQFSTDDDRMELDAIDREIATKARHIVLQAFDDVKTTINLEGMQLKEVPEEIKDMDNLVVFDFNPVIKNSYQLYLTNNKIRNLPPTLFAFTKLNVLGLRQNKLTEVPALIYKLQNLTDLYLGTNRLKYLPDKVLELPNLNVLSAGPNPYIEIPQDSVRYNIKVDSKRTLVAVSKVEFLQTNVSAVPTLRSLCLKSIATYDITYQETKNWKKYVPKSFHSIIANAIRQGQYKTTCSECDLILVEPSAQAFEWWDILENKKIPFRKIFCSTTCIYKWNSKIEKLVNKANSNIDETIDL